MELLSSNIKKFQETETLKNLLLFREMEPSSPPRENFLYYRKQKPGKNFLYFSKKAFLAFRTPRKIFLNFRKWNFFIFRERYIQNPSIFKTRSIFRTRAYLEPETYLEHCQRFAKNSFLVHFLVFREMELSSLSELEK